MVPVLFARSDSVYRSLGADCWDISRDARLWLGNAPLIAHPPCRAWGRLRHLAKPRPDERDLGVLAVQLVRAYGGVVEHPAASRLFHHMRCPVPDGLPDEWGGYTVQVNQSDWGHRALKPTWLYLVGITPAQLPPPPAAVAPQTTVERMCRREREATPPAFASYLLDLARIIRAGRLGLSIAPHPALSISAVGMGGCG